MSGIDRVDVQHIWDKYLTQGFEDKTVGWVIYMFLQEVDKGMCEKPIQEKEGFLNEIGLRRCFAQKQSDGMKRTLFKSSVRYLVGLCSPTLAASLISNNPDDVLKVIKKHKWKLNSKSNNERKGLKQNYRMDLRVTRFESQRDKDAGWGQVK